MMNPDKVPYLKTDGTAVSYLKAVVQWQDHQSAEADEWHKEFLDTKLDGFLLGAVNDMPATYYIPDLNVVLQAPHKVASSSLKNFVERIKSTYNLQAKRWESFDDYLRFINLHKPVVYRIVREPVCRTLSNINFHTKEFHKRFGASLDLAHFDPCIGTDPHSAPQSSSMLCYINQEVYDNIIKLRAERIRIYITKVISDENKVAYGTDADNLASLLEANLSDESLLQYYYKFKKIDTTHSHFYQDLYWAHLDDITLYENTKYLWITETNSSLFEFLAKELDLPKLAKNVVINNTPSVPIGGRMPYKVDTLDHDTKYKLYKSHKPEIDFLKGLHYENTEAIFYDQW